MFGDVPRFSGGGSGGGNVATKPTVRQAYITDGSGATLPSTSGAWVAVTGFALAIPAAVNDYVEIAVHAMRSNTSTAFLDVGVMVSGSVVRFMATGSSTGAGEGDPGFYFNNAFTGQSASRGFTVTSGDLSGGNVNFAMVCKSTAAAGTLYATTTYPFFWRAINMGAVS